MESIIEGTSIHFLGTKFDLVHCIHFEDRDSRWRRDWRFTFGLTWILVAVTLLFEFRKAIRYFSLQRVTRRWSWRQFRIDIFGIVRLFKLERVWSAMFQWRKIFGNTRCDACTQFVGWREIERSRSGHREIFVNFVHDRWRSNEWGVRRSRRWSFFLTG